MRGAESAVQAFLNKGVDMIKVKHTITGDFGITVGQRKDGSRAVLYLDNSIEWFEADAFVLYFQEV